MSSPINNKPLQLKARGTFLGYVPHCIAGGSPTHRASIFVVCSCCFVSFARPNVHVTLQYIYRCTYFIDYWKFQMWITILDADACWKIYFSSSVVTLGAPPIKTIVTRSSALRVIVVASMNVLTQGCSLSALYRAHLRVDCPIKDRMRFCNRILWRGNVSPPQSFFFLRVQFPLCSYFGFFTLKSLGSHLHFNKTSAFLPWIRQWGLFFHRTAYSAFSSKIMWEVCLFTPAV